MVLWYMHPHSKSAAVLKALLVSIIIIWQLANFNNWHLLDLPLDKNLLSGAFEGRHNNNGKHLNKLIKLPNSPRALMGKKKKRLLGLLGSLLPQNYGGAGAQGGPQAVGGTRTLLLSPWAFYLHLFMSIYLFLFFFSLVASIS